jgi:glycosyltransferase involved in cell wall biosynthesis
MKIGINALYLLPGRVGGSETYIRNLVKWLPIIDHENEYLVFINEESREVFDTPASSVTIVTCPVKASNRFKRILWEQFRLPVEVRNHAIDILFSAGMTAPFRCPATSVVMLFDLQHVNQPGNFSWYYLPFLRSIIYGSAKSADGVLTISHQVKRDIIRSYHIQSDRIAVTHLAVDHNLFTRIETFDANKVKKQYGLPDRFILYAASSLPHKNHERLFLAFRQVRDRIPELKLVLIGARDKGAESLLQKVQMIGIEQSVLLLGWLPFKDIPSIYRACEAFVFPTLHEGFGLPVLEAMASGIPVVCSKIEPLLEVAGNAAFFVDPHSPNEIAAGIFSALSEGPKREQIIQMGIAHAMNFTWESTARATVEFLQRKHSERGQDR